MKSGIFFLLVVLINCPFLLAYDKYITQSKREIPVIDTVDVVVAGGSSAGVAAAAEAARSGAKVFLVAPKAYLGEDICSFYRFGLPKAQIIDDPLAQKLFEEEDFVPRQFIYTATEASSRQHKDTSPPSLLNNGIWATAASHSVQYEKNVSITLDLKAAVKIPAVHVMAFHRPRDFVVDKFDVSVSNDRKDWKPVCTVYNDTSRKTIARDSVIDLKAHVGRQARYMKLDIYMPDEAKRLLLGEIIIETDLDEGGISRKYRIPPRPMQVKKTLDKELLDSGVDFLYRSYVTDLILDSKGKAAGVVIVNRSGRQAILAKSVIDATFHATAVRAANLPLSAHPGEKQKFTRFVLGAEVMQGTKATYEEVFFPVPQRKGIKNGLIFSMEYEMKEDSFAELSRIENAFRDQTWDKATLDSSENVFFIPSCHVSCRSSSDGFWPGADRINLDVFRPKKLDGFYVLNAYADLSRKAAEKLLEPVEYIKTGRRIGKAAAMDARRADVSPRPILSGKTEPPAQPGDIRELLTGPRPFSKSRKTILSPRQSLPVLAEYDVVVVGGGTGGAPAGISAARHGAKTLILEYVNGLGGASTVGLIGRYHFGHDIGFCAEIDAGVRSMGQLYAQNGREWNCQVKQEWFRQQARKAGADIWFDSMGCGAFVQGGTVKGVVVATHYGRAMVLCDVVIDGTGNADIAIAAGAAYRFSNDQDAAMQGTGYPPFNPGAMYTNTDYLIVDESDAMDVLRASLVAKEKFGTEYDLAPLIDTRERRRIVGDFELSPLDILLERTFSDTITWSRSNFDTHGFAVTPAFYVIHPDPESDGVNARVPYRCLLPQGLEGILVVGLGVSAHRDAIPIIRMQPDVHNQGYAAGLAAATASRENKSLRKIDIKQLQKQLVNKGNLPEFLLEETDDFSIDTSEIQKALDRILQEPVGIACVFAEPQKSLPLVRRAYHQTRSHEQKVLYARILGLLGDDTGIDTLIEEIESYTKWDEGYKWRSQGHEPFGRSISTLDGLIISAGFSKNKKALDPIIQKLILLEDKDDFTHHRAVALALESLGDSKAARPLWEHIRKPGIGGYAITDLQTAIDENNIKNMASVVQNTFREVILARALYRCGDCDQAGEKTLRQYENDLRGHFARCAHLILENE